MKIAASRDTAFITTLKSAAGFAIAATALVGVLAELTGANPERIDWLFYATTLVGAIVGAVFGGAGSGK
jgi:hypothetical protein